MLALFLLPRLQPAVRPRRCPADASRRSETPPPSAAPGRIRAGSTLTATSRGAGRRSRAAAQTPGTGWTPSRRRRPRDTPPACGRAPGQVAQRFVQERHERRVQREIVPAIVEVGREDERPALARRAVDERRLAGREPRQRLAVGARGSSRSGWNCTSPSDAAPRRTPEHRMAHVGRRQGARDVPRRAPAAAGSMRQIAAAEQLRPHLAVDVRSGGDEHAAALPHVRGEQLAAVCSSPRVDSSTIAVCASSRGCIPRRQRARRDPVDIVGAPSAPRPRAPAGRRTRRARDRRSL